MIITIMTIVSIFFIYVIGGCMYGIFASVARHRKRACDPLSKQGALIFLIWPYYILEDILDK